MKYIFYVLRPEQWVKNFLIFLPLIFGKKLISFPENLYSVIFFCIFSLAASIAYILNDINDIDKDRLHPTKRLRAITSGKVSIKQALILASVLTVIILPISFILEPRFGVIIIIYLVSNILYSRTLKNIVIIDVFCIAFLFFLRIAAGSIAGNVDMSHWIIFMVVLLALFLGFNKRRQEIILLSKRAEQHRTTLKRYNIYFIDQMSSIITASLAVVYILYTVDARTVNFFGTNHLIYTIPFVYYGIFKYLYIINSGYRKEGDPTRIFLYDKTIQLNILLWIATCVAIIYFGL